MKELNHNEDIRYKFNKVVDSLLSAFVRTKLDLYKKLSDPKISSTLSAIEENIQAEQTQKNSLDALFKTLLSLLMTGKIRAKDLEI